MLQQYHLRGRTIFQLSCFQFILQVRLPEQSKDRVNSLSYTTRGVIRLEIDQLKIDIGRRMEGALEVLQKEFAGLRTGRASISLLEPVTVEAYGQPMPMNQVGTIGVPEARLLTIQVWDKGLVSSVEKPSGSNLGLNPVSDGQLVECPFRPLARSGASN